jgi:hypothetical protein
VIANPPFKRWAAVSCMYPPTLYPHQTLRPPALPHWSIGLQAPTRRVATHSLVFLRNPPYPTSCRITWVFPWIASPCSRRCGFRIASSPFLAFPSVVHISLVPGSPPDRNSPRNSQSCTTSSVIALSHLRCLGSVTLNSSRLPCNPRPRGLPYNLLTVLPALEDG